jgi:phosphoribulokinase
VRSILGREGGRAVEYIEIDGSIPDAPARALERCILEQLDASGAETPDFLGEYDYHRGVEPGHSHPLALTQLLLVYHLLRAKQQDEAEE